MRSLFVAALLASLTSQASFAVNKSTRACAAALNSEKDYTLTEVVPGIFSLAFDENRAMMQTFLRFQEHDESPKFKAKTFSRKEFKTWYRRQNNGRFTYFSDFCGFNFPNHVLAPFYSGEFRWQTKKEKALLARFRALQESGEKFYIVGTLAGDESALDHEIAHGLYYTNPTYREKADAITDTLDLEPLHKWFADVGGYHKSVWRDEAQANLIDKSKYLFEKLDMDPEKYREGVKKLRALFKKYSGRTAKD